MPAVPWVVDTHVHVFDAALPFAPQGYHPAPEEAGSAPQLREEMRANGIARAVLVQPSGYGTDNRVLLKALAAGDGRFRGVAVPPPGAGRAVCEAFAAAGVAGVRFNMIDSGAPEDIGLAPLLPIARDLGWTVQVLCRPAAFREWMPVLERAGVRVILDHMGRPGPDGGHREPAYRAVLDFARANDVFVKISGPFRDSRRPPPYDDLDGAVAAVLEAVGPERCIWGSDWPFINRSGRPLPSYADQRLAIERWLPDSRERRLVLWETPARLFGFAEGGT